MGGLVVELTAIRQAAAEVTIHERQPSLGDVLAAMRAACLQRAGAGAAIDLPGIFGVARGAAPCLWISAGADVHVLHELLTAAPDVLEVNIEAGCPTARDVLLASGGWQATGASTHHVHTGPPPPLTMNAEIDVRAATSLDMRLVRRALAQAFHIPVRIVEAAYPDEFLDYAAPVELLLAKAATGELLGTVAYRRQNAAAMIFALTVNSEHRGRGLATALVTAAIAAAFDNGAEFAHGLTNDRSTPTARSLGAQPIGAWTHLRRSEPEITANN
jgi:GNAT superfamily N-acetyltransferase